MKKTLRRSLACLLAVLMVAFSMPISALADFGAYDATLNRNWWTDQGLKEEEVKAEPEYWGYNSDETYQELGSWCLGFGTAMEVGDNDENGYEDHRNDYKPVIGVTVSGIGTASDAVATLKTLSTSYYGASTAKTYDVVKNEGNILNPAQLKAGQRIAVTLEFGGFDVINNGQFKGTFDSNYLKAGSYPSTPARKDTWTTYTTSTSAAWMKTGADMGYGSALTFAGQNTNIADGVGTFYIAVIGGAPAAGQSTKSNFLGTGKNDPDGARPFGEYGIVSGVVCFEVLQDCDLKDVFHFTPTVRGVEDGTTFTPYAASTVGCTVDDGIYRVSVNSTSPDVFANAAVIWSEYKADEANHTHGFDGAVPVSNNDGTHTLTCTVDKCDKTEGYQQTVDCTFPADGEVTTAATCGKAGVKTFTCTECGYSYTEEILATGNHTWNEGVVTQAPNCTDEGVKTFTCTVCDETKTEAVNATGHTEVEIPAVEPDCTTPGSTAGTKCSVCGVIIVEPQPIPAKGHTEVEIPAVEADCTTPGSTAGVKCSVCNEILVAPVEIPAKGHTEVEIPAVAATCTTPGSTAGVKCSVCNEILVAPTEIPATGEHTWNEGVVTTEPTIRTEGEKTFTCTVCQETKTEAIPALGINVTVEAADLGSVSINGTDVSEGATTNVPYDSDVTLVAEPVEGATFMGWTANGTTLVSKDATFVTKALADVTYTAVFSLAVESDFTVTFVDSFGNVISTQRVTSGAGVQKPDAPIFVGYNFTGWSMTDEEIAALTSGAVITAQYELAEATFRVDAAGCTIKADGAEGTDYLENVAMDAVVTVTAAGATSWTVNGATVGYGESYTFFATGNVTIVPSFETVVAATPTVVAVSADRIAGSHKVAFVATRSMTDDCTYVNAGFVYGKDLAEADLTLDMVGKKGSNATSGTVKAIYCATDAEQFILNYGVTAATGTASARAFLAYIDANGDTQVIYAAPQVYTY